MSACLPMDLIATPGRYGRADTGKIKRNPFAAVYKAVDRCIAIACADLPDHRAIITAKQIVMDQL